MLSFVCFRYEDLSTIVQGDDPPLAFFLSHLLTAAAAQQDVPQVHQIGQQGVTFLTLANQVAPSRVPGRRPAGHHFVPTGRAAAHRRRNYAVELCYGRCHEVYDVRGGRSAWPLQGRRDVVF